MEEGSAFQGSGARSPPSPLLAVVRDALVGGGRRIALRVPAMTPHRRRVARALLNEGALAAGGIVVEGPGQDLLLVGAEAGRGERLRQLLDKLLGLPATGLWSLDRDAAALLGYAVGGDAPPTEAPIPAPDLAGLDAWLSALPLARVVRRQAALRLDGETWAARDVLRLEVARETLASLLGPLGVDADLLDHARRSLAARLLLAMADRSQRRELAGERPPAVLHLPLPCGPAVESLAGCGMAGLRLVGTLALPELADPAAFAACRAALAAQGWGVEVDGLSAAALPLLAAEAVAADLLRLRWSPDLMAPAASDAVRCLGPGRVVLAGVADQAGLDWAHELGVPQVEGPIAEATLAALRNRDSPLVVGDAPPEPAPPVSPA